MDLEKTMKGKMEKAAKDALKDLALMTHAHIAERVQKELHSSRDKYIEAMDIRPDGDTWIISLDKSAMWIEEGIEAGHEMIDDLLKSPKAKTAADGSKYMVIPFQHNKGPSQQTAAATNLTDTIRQELKKRQIPYNKIEKDQNGVPKQGLLHKFNIMNRPLKTHNGPGQGHGGVGEVKQGNTGIPFLQGIRVYQKEVKNAKTGKSSIQRSIMTFRIVSSKQKGSGKWIHPGLQAKLFFDEAAQWALELWDKKIKQQLEVTIASTL